MSILLTPSQTNIFKNIAKELNHPSISRPNYILTGKPGVGKTYLAKYICQEENGRYVSFVHEYGEKFLKEVDILDADGTDLLQFIEREIVANEREKNFFIDDLEFIFNYIFKNKKVERFLKNYKRLYYFNKVILVLPSIYFDELSDENIFQISFTNEDKFFLADHYCIAKSVACDFENGYYFRGE